MAFLEKNSFPENIPMEWESQIPKEFTVFRKEINTLAALPLEERFSESEVLKMLRATEEQEETFKKEFPANNHGKPFTEEDIANFREKEYPESVRRIFKRISETELMRLIQESGILFEQETEEAGEAEAFSWPFICKNEECLKTTEGIESIYKGHDEQNLSGDYFQVKRQNSGKKTLTNIFLIDAQGHGGGATPLALLAASFLESAEKAGIKDTPSALDEYLDSLKINRKEVSLQKISIEETEGENTKKISFLQAGEGYVFWIDGSKEEGYRVKIISPEEIRKNEAVDWLPFEEGSITGNIGFGTLPLIAEKEGPLHSQIINIRNDASIFFSTDGIFDSLDHRTGNRFKEEFSDMCLRVLKETHGKERKNVENRLSEEIRKISKEYEQTDDMTMVRITPKN